MKTLIKNGTVVTATAQVHPMDPAVTSGDAASLPQPPSVPPPPPMVRGRSWVASEVARRLNAQVDVFTRVHSRCY